MDFEGAVSGGARRAAAIALVAMTACGSRDVATAGASETVVAERATESEIGHEARGEVEDGTEGEATPEADATPCAEVAIGLDLRALPRDHSPGAMAHYVGAEAQRFAAQAPPGAQARVERARDHSAFHAWFDADTTATAIARCEETVEAYLAVAPRLPIIMESAARVLTPCRACGPREAGSDRQPGRP
jgi:hypothetical protein